nr:L protein [Shanxi Armigeres subalbatus rhabdovirus]
MEDFEESFETDNNWEEWDEDFFADNDDQLNVRRKFVKKEDIPLINDDFSLNSPIMVDIINNLVSYNTTGRFLGHHKNRSERVWKDFDLNNLSFPNIQNISRSYYRIYEILLQKEEFITAHTYKLLKIIDEEVVNNSPIPDLFLRTIGSYPKLINLYDLISNDMEMMTLYQRSLEINLIIEIMVSGHSRLTLKNYEPSYLIKPMSKGNIIQLETTNFKGYLTDEILYDTNNDVILDKNMLLMLKDIITGRLNTLILIGLNIDDKYSPDMDVIFKTIIKEGDHMLLHSGNIGFESIALLEPMCIERLSNLANSTRPKIKNPDTFSKYLDSKMSTDNKLNTIFRLKVREIISKIENVQDLTVLYGSFRLWGHPYIEYEEGLNRVKKQVRMEKSSIDKNYAKLLANDLMKKMLMRHFHTTKLWNVKNNDHNKNILGTESLILNKWPKMREFDQLEGRWDELDIEPILEIPEDIEDSVIFADKTHSYNRSEVESFVKRDKQNPIPTKRVLKTYLERPRVNIKDFILEIDACGLKWDDLIIGLKAKERELKRFGRFFTLMSWNLRLYFVISEYMIKKDLVKVFPGLTMADGSIDIIKKMLDRTKGQRNDEYKNITYANHIDYEKWNNHQRDEAVGPVFTVLDKLYGLNNFFRRTHHFFKDCAVYYPERPESYGIDGTFFWNGQPGGFEGIRQKGWSLVGILCLMRESRYSNTKIDFLVQGDNQDVFTNYLINGKLTETELEHELNEIFRNNDVIMQRIKVASEKIGLIINEDETVQSSGFTVYGKVPIYKGNILNLETKKVNRVSSVTNDQLPTAANIMSSVNSTALTVCQFDPTIRNGVYIHEIFGIMALNSIKLWNPMGLFGENPIKYKKSSVAKWLYFDQCLGGNTGMALTRMLVRRFPDPISEGLSFYREMHLNLTDDKLKETFLAMGYPTYKRITATSLNKLLEDPTSLNIMKGSNISVIIRDQVKKSLINYSDNIKNKLLQNSLIKSENHEIYLIEFLETINPVFPRFLSDFRQASICGYIDSVVGLVQNSKTIRIMFSHEFEDKIRKLVSKWESEQMKRLQIDQTNIDLIWSCSSLHSDKLRNESWRRNLVGTTIPHPYEYQRKWIPNIREHLNLYDDKTLISCIMKKKYSKDINYHGDSTPYLGSNTKETSSALQPWEKELTNPIFQKASNLRRGINWLIKPSSRLATSIYNNLKYVTNIDLKEEITSLKKHRTGTAQHRYKSNRQDNGGFCNITPNILSWMMVTSDYMTDLSDVNYDFMFQASLIFTETYGAHVVSQGINVSSFGLGLSCQSCIRPIGDLLLESSIIYNPSTINKTFWLNKMVKTTVTENNNMLKDLFPVTDKIMKDVSYMVGVHQSVASMLCISKIDESIQLSDVFSIGTMMKINPSTWLKGFIDGLLISGAYNTLNSLEFKSDKTIKYRILNKTYNLSKTISHDSNFLPILRLNNINDWLTHKSGYVCPSYPPTNANLSRAFSSLAVSGIIERYEIRDNWLKEINNFIIFNEFDFDGFEIALLLGYKLLAEIKSDLTNIKRDRMVSSVFQLYKEYKGSPNDKKLRAELIEELDFRNRRIQVSSQELRFAIENATIIKEPLDEEIVYNDTEGYELVGLDLNKNRNQHNSKKRSGLESPFISSLRAYRCATGAHYKMNDILNFCVKNVNYALVGGDGSGGMSSLVLRKYPSCNVIFNSLMEYDEVSLKGSQPGKPQAIMKLPQVYRNRCININNCWMEPSDLTDVTCWDNFRRYTAGFQKRGFKLDLIILDMEARIVKDYQSIYRHAANFIKGNLNEGGYAIMKTYTWCIEETTCELSTIIDEGDLLIVTGRYTSSYSTEIYYVYRYKRAITDRKSIKWTNDIRDLNRSFASDVEEFARAMTINLNDLYSRIPVALRENYESYIMDYLNQIGITPSYGSIFLRLFMQGAENKSVLGIIHQSCISQSSDQNIVSSSQLLTKVICLIISILYYKAYIRGSIEYFKRGNILNNSRINVLNNKLNQTFYLSVEKYESYDIHCKVIGPVRDSTFINLITRSLLGCHYTSEYPEDKDIWAIKIPKFTTNVLEWIQ